MCKNELNKYTTQTTTGSAKWSTTFVETFTVIFASNIKLNTLDPVALSLWVGGTILSMIVLYFL